MRYLLLVCLLFSISTITTAAPTLKDARKQWLRGHHEDAIEAYQELAKDAKTRGAASVGISRVHETLGEYDKGLDVLAAALKEEPKNADLLGRQAELFYLRGKWDEADKAVAAALAESKDHLAAKWVEAQLLRDRGEVEKADKACRWFVRNYSERSGTDKEITAPEELVIVGHAAAEYARWHGLSDEFETILNDLYGDAAKNDKDYWPAEVAAGFLLLEKYNRPQALDAFDKALKIDGTCPDALVGKGRSAFQRFEFKDAESYAERALKTNSNHLEALRLVADVHLTGGDVKGAMKELETARKINPRDEATLGRIGVCLTLDGKKAELDKLTEEVKKFDSKPALFYYEMGQVLETRRRYAEAEKLFRAAMAQRPNLPGPATNLGLLLMRMGQEKEGKELLDKAFKADSFNVKVSNMRRVLKHMEAYATHKTEHFEIRHDPKSDEVLAKYMGEMLEDTYKELAGKFDHRPKGPILIEVFNNHDMFSGRTVGVPDLHTIGACTGKLVTMVSPTGKGVPRAFNWGRVMRHELVHIFNLEQTNFLVPHWVTEGLAVENEGFPRPQPWNGMLKRRVAADKLLNLETIDLGFMRPRDPEEWQLAYCQAQLYMKYIVKTYKQEAVGKLLAAFGEGLGVEAALKKACDGVERATFEKGYREYLNEVVAEIGGTKADERRPFAEIKADYDKNRNDPDIGAEYAEAMLSRDRAEARKLAQAVLTKKAGHPRASLVLAKLAGLGGDKDEQKRLLEAAREKNPDPRVLRELVKLYYDAMEWARAGEVAEQGRKAEPFDSFWAEQLQRVYAQSGNKQKLIGILKELVLADADELDRRKRLARLLDEAGDPAGAEQAARQVLEISVKDKDARDLLLKSLEKLNRKDDAERLRKILE